MKALLIVIIILAMLIIAAVCRCIYEIHSLSVSRYKVKTDRVLPENGLRVVFLSDLHGRKYGDKNEKLIELIRNEHPDIILIGGDLVVSNNPDKDAVALDFLSYLPDIAPVYAALGNHEKAVSVLESFKERNSKIRAFLKEKNIILLENSAFLLNGDIDVYGLDLDYCYYRKFHRVEISGEEMDHFLKGVNKEKYTVIMAHNPMFFEQYVHCGADLVLSGHLHGGTVRIPGIGGIISPQLKLFPKYDKGAFTKDKTTMIVTSGSGSHSVNIRLFNKPEIVSIEITGERGTN